MKKVMYCIIVFCIFLSVSVSADNLATVTVNSKVIDDEIVVSVAIDNNAGIAGFKFTVNYDNKQVIPISVESGEVLKNYNIISNIQQDIDLSKIDKVTACVISPGNINGNGVLYNIKFKKLDNSENIEFVLNYNDNDIVNENIENVSIKIVNNTIKEKPAQTVTPTEKPSVKKTGGGGGSAGSAVTPSPSPSVSPIHTEPPIISSSIPEQVNENKTINNKFTDVNENDWYYDAVMWGSSSGLINGVSDTEFAPEESVTRAMLVTMLYRYAGDKSIYTDNYFADIQSDDWYYNAVMWAYSNKITAGVGNGLFAPDESITREQIAKILYLYAQKIGLNIDTSVNELQYLDADIISDWAYQAMVWATDKKYIKGRGENMIVPLGKASRAEVITILQRFSESEKG